METAHSVEAFSFVAPLEKGRRGAGVVDGRSKVRRGRGLLCLSLSTEKIFQRHGLSVREGGRIDAKRGARSELIMGKMREGGG